MNNNFQGSFIVEGPAKLKGEVLLSGSKNAAFPLLAAAILTNEEMIFSNVPNVADVSLFLEILKKMGAAVTRKENKLYLNCSKIDPKKLDFRLVSKLRGSIVLIGALLARFHQVEITEPGGCFIGVRSIDTHLDAFRDLGVEVSKELYFDDNGLAKGYKYIFSFKESCLNDKIMLNEFSVTASENIILFAAGLNKKINIWGVAVEPHVGELCQVLSLMGVQIKGINTHELIIQGSQKLKGISYHIGPDYLEAGTFAVAAALTKSDIIIKPFPYNDLKAVLVVFKKMGLSWEFDEKSKSFKLTNISTIKATVIRTDIHPGFPSDLQAPFGVLATQAQGTTLLFETLYEGRLKYLSELQKLGASIIIADAHRALITGPTPLIGGEIESFDIRAGATMILAALVARGKTLIKNASQIDRGYENFDKKLTNLGASIKRVIL